MGRKRNRDRGRERIQKDADAQPDNIDHNKSIFGNFESDVYIVHRVGPGREFEKLHGPYRDKRQAQSKLAEHVEHFIRENSSYNPHVAFKGQDAAKVLVAGIAGTREESFFYAVKPLTV